MTPPITRQPSFAKRDSGVQNPVYSPQAKLLERNVEAARFTLVASASIKDGEGWGAVFKALKEQKKPNQTNWGAVGKIAASIILSLGLTFTVAKTVLAQDAAKEFKKGKPVAALQVPGPTQVAQAPTTGTGPEPVIQVAMGTQEPVSWDTTSYARSLSNGNITKAFVYIDAEANQLKTQFTQKDGTTKKVDLYTLGELLTGFVEGSVRYIGGASSDGIDAVALKGISKETREVEYSLILIKKGPGKHAIDFGTRGIPVSISAEENRFVITYSDGSKDSVKMVEGSYQSSGVKGEEIIKTKGYDDKKDYSVILTPIEDKQASASTKTNGEIALTNTAQR